MNYTIEQATSDIVETERIYRLRGERHIKSKSADIIATGVAYIQQANGLLVALDYLNKITK